MESKPDRKSIIEAIETATQAEPGSISELAKLQGLSGWDSLGIVGFMQVVLDNFGIELSVDDVLECATVNELVDRVLAH